MRIEQEIDQKERFTRMYNTGAELKRQIDSAYIRLIYDRVNAKDADNKTYINDLIDGLARAKKLVDVVVRGLKIEVEFPILLKYSIVLR